jgi:hypothetical protein
MSNDEQFRIPPDVLEEIKREMAENEARWEAEEPGNWTRAMLEMEADPTWPDLPIDEEDPASYAE